MREFGSEHPAIVLPDGYFNIFDQYGREVSYLRSGREALLLAALSCRLKVNEKDNVALIPAYCCWSMSAPFTKAGWRIVYYRLNEDLTVDVDYLIHLIDTVNPQTILTMNYFGSTPTNEAVVAVKDRNPHIVVIEDFSHCTFSFADIYNPLVDIYVSSIRKSIGVCDGAVILSSLPLKRDYIQTDTEGFADIRYRAQVEKKLYQWTYNQLTNRNFREILRGGEGIIDNFKQVHSISERGRQMLSIVNGSLVAYARKVNMDHLLRLLRGKIRTVPRLERSLTGAPFSCPILVERRDNMQKTLADNGLYAPILWPINETAQKVCPVSKMMGEKMLSIPIDQRYDWNDIEQIAEILLTTLNRGNS